MTQFKVNLSDRASPLPHHWEFSLGSGNASLALRADWQEQVARCKRELGVKHIRFHGVLSDFMGTLIEQNNQLVYSFFNADAAYDALLRMGVRPLVELSFMPSALAAGDEKVFHYQANISPAKNIEKWLELIRRLFSHWVEHYGADALLDWPVEVWNEPNLNAFWTENRGAYFDFYTQTARALKEVSPSFRVGGPVTAKNEWVEEFLAHVVKTDAPCDFVSTHYYPTDAFGKESSDTREQLKLSSRHALREQLSRARQLTTGRPLYLTEWNMTSNPRDQLHDEPMAAAYLVKAALELDGLVQGSSWWTFSDIFAENYFPSQPFHGGFGLLSLHGIPKPSYRGMQLLHQLGEERLPVAGESPTLDCWMTRTPSALQIMLTSLSLPDEPLRSEQAVVEIQGAPRPNRVSVQRVDADHANPRREWVDMGKPEYLKSRDVERLLCSSALMEEEVHFEWAADRLTLHVGLSGNAVALVTCQFDDAQLLGQNVADPSTSSAQLGKHQIEPG